MGKILVYGVLIHLLFGILMFSGDMIFTSKTFSTEGEYEAYTKLYKGVEWSEKVTQNHVVVLTIMFVLLVAAIIIKQLFGGGARFLFFLYKTLCCKKDAVKTKFNALNVTYKTASRRCLIKGLPSYNVLENPVYSNAFRIDTSFASAHKHVDSVTEFNME